MENFSYEANQFILIDEENTVVSDRCKTSHQILYIYTYVCITIFYIHTHMRARNL